MLHMPLKNIMLSKRSQTQKTTLLGTLTGNVQNVQIYGNTVES
jgi:hypothetical protein